MMQFRSLEDLARIVRAGAPGLRDDYELIVGVPRSGMLPATMIALLRNRPLLDLPSFLRGDLPENGLTRRLDGGAVTDLAQLSRVLVVEDSLSSGRSLMAVRARIAAARPDLAVDYLAAIAAPETAHLADLHFDICPHPRCFEWNLMNSPVCADTLFDLDGVFCRDPEPSQNDDGPAYRAFIETAAQINRPRRPVRGVVTARLGAYRAGTAAWLAANGVETDRLEMLEGVTAAERREKRLHAPHKAKVYAADRGALLFVESDPAQAREIARLSGKPVLDFARMVLVGPDAASPAYAARRAEAGIARARAFAGRVRRRLRRALGLGPRV